MTERFTSLDLPKNELFYYDNDDAVLKPLKPNFSNILVGRLKNTDSQNKAIPLDNINTIEVTVIARKGNIGSIYVGGSDVSDVNFGVELLANESFTFRVSNSNKIYISSSISGEGVSYVAI